MYGPVDKDEHNFGAHAIGVVRPPQKDVQTHRACAQAAHGKRGGQRFVEAAGRDEVHFEVDGGKTPATIRNDFREREMQVFAKPVFHEAVEHLEISRIKYDTGGIAIREPHGNLGLVRASLPRGVRHAKARFLEMP